MSWLKYRGVVLPKRTRKKKDGSYHKTETIDKLAVVELLRGELPEDVRLMLRNRAEASKAASLAKLNRVEPMVGTDGRLRFALNYCGAHTGRWTSEGLQLHNLPKNQLTAAASALVRDLVEAEDPQALELVEARPLEALSQMLRSVVVAPPGRELIGADFSAIEARVCAWLAGQDDVVMFFHEFDAQRRAGGKPKDFYIFTAESIDSDERQLGKVAALALQYGMGDVTFAGTAAKWGVPLTLLRARQVKLSWRLVNRCIAQWWRDLEDAAFAAVLEPGSKHRAGRVSFRSTGKVLLMRLPSGRSIRYWQPSIVLKTRVFQLVDDEGKQVQKSVTREELQFWKPARGAMVAETTYGGKLAENATQAVARELLAAGLVRLDGVAPYELVIHVHDSAAAEVPEGEGDPADFADRLAAAPPWAAGCPVAAEGWRDRRFRG
jgi:DNA polymerase